LSSEKAKDDAMKRSGPKMTLAIKKQLESKKIRVERMTKRSDKMMLEREFFLKEVDDD
jgi:hypothetical protein